eukprot:jgi/Orpsp1_1/1187235/evm.model.d7180000056268.1
MKILYLLSTSLSINKKYWKNLLDVNFSINRIRNINNPFEIQETILSMKNNKAPGLDDIPIKFFKAFFNEPESSDNSTFNSF